MRPARRTLIRSGWAALAVLAGACSAGDRPEAASAPPSRAEPSSQLSVTAREFRFEDPEWAVPAGRPIDIEFINDGTIPHEWAVLRLGAGVSTPEEFRDDLVLFEVEALPEKTTTTARFSIEQPGRYEIICALEGHIGAGMRGTLDVISQPEA